MMYLPTQICIYTGGFNLIEKNIMTSECEGHYELKISYAIFSEIFPRGEIGHQRLWNGGKYIKFLLINC